MKKSYTANYFKTYFWKALSIFLNLAAMFIVVPKLSSMPAIYGIYIVCISTMIFLRYSDLGFLVSGYKYASEYYYNFMNLFCKYGYMYSPYSFISYLKKFNVYKDPLAFINDDWIENNKKILK